MNSDEFTALVSRARSVRRFDGLRPISVAALRELVNLARLSPCAGNKQTLRYRLVADAAANEAVFGTLSWAGYLSDWDGPKENERPAAYIIILRNTAPGMNCPTDEGIAAQSIFLGAAAAGMCGCFIGCINRPELARRLDLAAVPELTQYEIALVIALGYPQEKVFLEEMPGGGADIKYYRDAAGGHHVPKRCLDDLLV